MGLNLDYPVVVVGQERKGQGHPSEEELELAERRTTVDRSLSRVAGQCRRELQAYESLGCSGVLHVLREKFCKSESHLSLERTGLLRRLESPTTNDRL